MTLATVGACGRQHNGVVSLVLAGPTPGPVVRRQERLRHSAEIILYAELAERCPMTTRHQEDGAMHKSTAGAREKPTKVNVDDEGRSRVRSGNGVTPAVGKESRPEEEHMCHTFCVMKQTEYGEREDGSACGKLLEESQQTNWRN